MFFQDDQLGGLNDCDRLSSWLPNLQTIPEVVFPGQGIGAYPFVMKDGGLGIVMNADSGGFPSPTGQDEPELGLNTKLVFIRAPLAGQTPFPAPLQFLPPENIGSNMATAVPAQRAGTLPAAAVDPHSGAIYATWEDLALAFSRNGTFEGDYNQIASSGGYTYIVRSQGHKDDGPQPLVPNPNGSNTLVLTEAGKGHQHQYNWVALVQERK